MKASLIGFWAITLCSLHVRVALGADPQELKQARTWFDEGEQHLHQGQFREARDDFMRVLERVPVPAVALFAARAHEKLGELTKAAELFTLAVEMSQNDLWADPQTQQNAQQEARLAFNELLPRIATVQFELRNAQAGDVEVTLDGKSVANASVAAPRPLPAGEHAVTATTKSGRSIYLKFPLAETEKKVVPIDLALATTAAAAEPSPPPVPTRPAIAGHTLGGKEASGTPKPRVPAADDSRKILAWTAFGVGAAGLLVGATTGIVTWVKYSKLRDDGCSSGLVCPESVSDSRIDSFNTWRMIPTPAFIVTGVSAAIGTGMMFLGNEKRGPNETQGNVHATVGLGGIAVSGSF